tara:strand:- start:653 stop:1111 length:459 start_codon:yes stop_codon:yes gene_type:complete
MNKILNYTLLLFLFTLFGCGFKPILTSKGYQFSININTISGDQKVNSIITNRFKSLKENENKYDLNLSSKKIKKIISKDSKGDTTMFELVIDIKYNVEKSGEIIIQNTIKERTTYNNITDKFELENYENNIIDNLSNKISNKIISSISDIDQ